MQWESQKNDVGMEDVLEVSPCESNNWYLEVCMCGRKQAGGRTG